MRGIQWIMEGILILREDFLSSLGSYEIPYRGWHSSMLQVRIVNMQTIHITKKTVIFVLSLHITKTVYMEQLFGTRMIVLIVKLQNELIIAMNLKIWLTVTSVTIQKT